MAKNLIPTFTAGGENRLDLFRTWLEKGQDFSLVELEVTRKNSQSQMAKTTEKCMSKRELEQDPRYSPDDVKELIERKKRLGHYIRDPNFPDREDLIQYIVNSETSQENAHTREDSQNLKSTTSITPAEGLDLTESGAVFAANATPGVHALMDTAGGGPPNDGENGGNGEAGGKAKGKGKNHRPKPKPKAKAIATNPDGTPVDPEPDKPPTPLEKAVLLKKSVFLVWKPYSNGWGLESRRYAVLDLMFVENLLKNHIQCHPSPIPGYLSFTPRLKEAEEARTLCISIEGLECAGELVSALTTHSTAMTALFRELNGHTMGGVNDLQIYQPLFEKATSYTNWFKSRKKVANTMKAAATTKSA